MQRQKNLTLTHQSHLDYFNNRCVYIWDDIRASKWWDSFYIWMNCSCKFMKGFPACLSKHNIRRWPATLSALSRYSRPPRAEALWGALALSSVFFTQLANTHRFHLLAYSNRRSCQTQSTASPASRQTDGCLRFRRSRDTHLHRTTYLKPQHASLSPLSTAHSPIHNNETGDFHGAVRNDLILAGWMIAIGFASSDN